MAILHHYSRVPGLKTLDPQFQGTGAKGAENKHGVPDVKVTYFYREGAPTEDLVTQQAQSRYTVEAPDEHLYDIGTDPHGILSGLREQSQNRQINPGQVTRDEMLGAVRDAGHHGFYNSKSHLPHAVGMFHPTQPIKEENTQELNMKKAQVDQGKSPEQKAQDRSERNVRHASGKGSYQEKRDIESGQPSYKGGPKVVGEEHDIKGVHRTKGDFTRKDAKAQSVKVSNQAYGIKPNLTKDEDLEKASKNVREQRAKVFGTQSQPPKGSAMRQKHMEHIRDYVKRKYGLELQSSGGKWDEKTQGRRSDNPEVGVDKPDWRSGQLESQDNPEAQVHELAHLEELPEGTDLPEGQRLMDRRYADVQKEHGYMKQKRSQGEIQPMAMENPIRRRMGLPATDISTPVKPGQEPRTAVDTGEPAAVRVPQGNKEVDLIRQSRLRSPENVERQRQIDEGILTWTDKGWAPGTTVDSKINARQYMQEQGANPVEANRIAAEAGGKPEANEAFDAAYPQKLAASEGPEIDDETLRQLVQERFGIDLPQQQDPAKILRLAEMYAHGSARKYEAPDEAALPNLMKEPMTKAIDRHNKYNSSIKGVHRQQAMIPTAKDKGQSAMGQNVRHGWGGKGEAKNLAEKTLAENRSMKKPNLP